MKFGRKLKLHIMLGFPLWQLSKQKWPMGTGNMSRHPFVWEGVFSQNHWIFSVGKDGYPSMRILKILFLATGQSQKSHRVFKSIVKMLLDLCCSGAVTTALGNLFQYPANLWVKNIFPKIFSSDFLLSLSAQNRGQGPWMGKTEIFRPHCAQGECCCWNPNSSP